MLILSASHNNYMAACCHSELIVTAYDIVKFNLSFVICFIVFSSSARCSLHQYNELIAYVIISHMIHCDSIWHLSYRFVICFILFSSSARCSLPQWTSCMLLSLAYALLIRIHCDSCSCRSTEYICYHSSYIHGLLSICMFQPTTSQLFHVKLKTWRSLHKKCTSIPKKEK